MKKYQLTIVEITPPEKEGAYEIKRTIFDQTLDTLDVAKVVISANEGNQRVTAAARD
jgi:hypothetical protein